MDWNNVIPASLVIVAASFAFIANPRSAPAQGRGGAQPKPRTQSVRPAQLNKTQPVDHFTGTTANIGPDTGEIVTIDVQRWSTDAETSKFVDAYLLGPRPCEICAPTKSAQQLHEALQAAPTIGYIWMARESVGYGLRYAQRMSMANNSERILLATDRPLWSWRGEATPTDYPLTVIELRLSRGAAGEGKTSLAAKLAVDADNKALALEGYETAPVLLKGVQRVQSAEKPAQGPQPTRRGGP